MSEKPVIRWQAFQGVAVYPPPSLVEEINTTWLPEGVITEEASMAMEKRAVVNTDKEKTAARKVEKSLPQDKPNQQPKPPTKKDK